MAAHFVAKDPALQIVADRDCGVLYRLRDGLHVKFAEPHALPFKLKHIHQTEVVRIREEEVAAQYQRRLAMICVLLHQQGSGPVGVVL
jgi:hypothetical protein